MVVVLLAFSTFVGFAQSSTDTGSQAQSPRPRMTHVSPVVLVGLAERKVLPQYPEEALKKGVQGDAIFKVAVDENGTWRSF